MFAFLKKHFKRILEKEKEEQRKRNRQGREQKRIERDRWSGTINYTNNRIEYSRAGEILCNFKLADIKIIGELTTDSGPASDDWYYVFICGTEPENTHYLSRYALGHKKLEHAIEEHFNIEMKSHLFYKTSNEDSIIYPPNLDGESIFEYKSLEPVGFWETVGKSLRLGEPIEIHFSKKVNQYLAEQ